MMQISSATSSCAASVPRRSASIAERVSVATTTRVDDWDAARRKTGKCLWPCSVAGHAARQVHARLPAAVRWSPTGSSAVRPAAWAIWSQRSVGRLKRRSPDILRGVLGVPWLEDARPVSAHSVPEENSVLNKRGAYVVRGDPHVASDASHLHEDGVPRQRNTRRRPLMHRQRHSFRADHATHVLNMSETGAAFALCGCAEPNDPPQRCWIRCPVERSILRCRSAASPGRGGGCWPDTVQSPRHRGATHCG
ncbi:hypothetical protein MOQ_007699, partial [Trypanosoma cruzi marinkellei]